MENRFGPDSDLEFPEAGAIPEEYSEPMESCDKEVTFFSVPTESHLIRRGKNDWGRHGCLKDMQSSYGSIQESKPSTDNFTESVFSIKSMPTCMLGQSLPNQVSEELKSESSVIKKEETLHKFSLQSYDLDEKVTGKRSKQERNRESAKKCRQRKKEYLMNLENELKTTKEELAACRNELKILKGNVLTKIEEEYNKLKEELLTQAKNIIECGALNVKLDEFVNTISVIQSISIDCS
jgi:hypothetical protein